MQNEHGGNEILICIKKKKGHAVAGFFRLPFFMNCFRLTACFYSCGKGYSDD